MTGPAPLQNPPLGCGAAYVIARDWTWMQTRVATFGQVRRSNVAPCTPEGPDLDTLLEPFDRLATIAAPHRARKVSSAWLRAWVARWPATAWPEVPLSAPIDLPIALLPHQLAPARAVARGAGCRLLLADAVGQGKTIEAGLVLCELAARGAADRVLILTPLSLRDQWVAELRQRCRVTGEVVDRAALRARERETPAGVHPFQPPGVVVLSADLTKQPDVLARLAGVCWDVLVIDEAHGVCGDSARAAAAAALGARARVVLLLTATPHAGDARAFDRLCAIGRLTGEPPLLWFRHRPDRRAAGLPRSRDVSLACTREERACATALGRYVRQLDLTRAPAARLIAVVLRKRALSSPAALAASLRHRLAWLTRQPAVTRQQTLPFGDECEQEDADQPPVLTERGLADVGAEAALLESACRAAERASASWSKLRALRRVIGRTREQVLVFTEYRDTLTALATALGSTVPVVTLHGGSSRAERGSAVAQFERGQVRVLAATDVASEGLNLQRACRFVAHVELPWSPARLEQRNGRVDRLGQTRRVHVWRLLGDPRHESRIVTALSARVARMRAAGIDVGPLAVPSTAWAGEPADGVHEAGMVTPADEETAHPASDAARLRHLFEHCRRAFTGRPPSRVATSLPWLESRRWRGGAPQGVTIVCLVPAPVRGARPVLVPVHVALSPWPPGSPSRWLPGVAGAAVAVASANRPEAPLTDALADRERRLLARAAADERRLAGRWQGSLFERRAARVVEAARSAAASATQEHARRIDEFDRPSGGAGAVAVLALLVR